MYIAEDLADIYPGVDKHHCVPILASIDITFPSTSVLRGQHLILGKEPDGLITGMRIKVLFLPGINKFLYFTQKDSDVPTNLSLFVMIGDFSIDKEVLSVW